MMDNFPKLVSDSKPQIQEAQRTPSQINANKQTNKTLSKNQKTYTWAFKL